MYSFLLAVLLSIAGLSTALVLPSSDGSTIQALNVEPKHPLSNEERGVGPMPNETLMKHPRLSFIGRINGKSYYLERTKMTQMESIEFCIELGMELGRFDTKEEYQFVFDNTLRSDQYLWTSGESIPSLSHFKWREGDPVNTSFEYGYYWDTRTGIILQVHRQPPIPTKTYELPFGEGKALIVGEKTYRLGKGLLH